jgi:hypothetical protein
MSRRRCQNVVTTQILACVCFHACTRALYFVLFHPMQARAARNTSPANTATQRYADSEVLGVRAGVHRIAYAKLRSDAESMK